MYIRTSFSLTSQLNSIYAECKAVDHSGPISKTVLVCFHYSERENYDPADQNKIVRVSLPTDSYQSFAGSCHHRGRMSWVPPSRKCTSCVPRSLLHVYHTQTRPKGPHSQGNKPAAQRGTPPKVYPLILSMTWKETHRGRNDATHTRYGRLGRESSAADGHRTKIPWTWFDILLLVTVIVLETCSLVL
jgi:hypothetical protein